MTEPVLPPGGIKHDQGKPRISLLPGGHALAIIARVMEYGLRKYPEGNWKLVSPDRYRDALARHFAAWLDKPDGVDEESGLPHLAHMAACAMILLWHAAQLPDEDDV